MATNSNPNFCAAKLKTFSAITALEDGMGMAYIKRAQIQLESKSKTVDQKLKTANYYW